MQRGVVINDTPDGVFIQQQDHRIILNTAHLIQMVRAECIRHKEISVVNLDDPVELDLFMNDLFSSVEHYLNFHTVEHLRRTIDDCLDRAQEYTYYQFTSMQRYLWMEVARDIISQTYEYGLRDTYLVSKYVYDSMMGHSMVLRPYDE